MSRNHLIARATVLLSDDRGIVHLTQERPEYDVRVEIEAEGFAPGMHGIHIHEFGDMSRGCASMGDHFNPSQSVHGGRESQVRHAGDMGNVRADINGHIRDTFRVKGISLFDSDVHRSVLGRGLVIHEGRDDLGRRDTKESLKTGHSGARTACGVVQRDR